MTIAAFEAVTSVGTHGIVGAVAAIITLGVRVCEASAVAEVSQRDLGRGLRHQQKSQHAFGALVERKGAFVERSKNHARTRAPTEVRTAGARAAQRMRPLAPTTTSGGGSQRWLKVAPIRARNSCFLALHLALLDLFRAAGQR